MFAPFRLLSAVVVVLFSSVSVAFESEPAEGAPVFFAKDLLPAELRSSAVHRVHPIVEVRDFAYIFKVESEYGDFETSGVAALRKLIHEIEVISMLEETSRSEAFAASLSRSFTEPVMMTVGIARRPISTVTGLPAGIVRYLGGKFHQVKRGSQKAMTKIKREEERKEPDSEDSGTRTERLSRSAGELSKRHLGYDSAKRKWAQRLGVDPYSSNLALQEELGRISWASSLGDFAGDFAMPASEVVSYAGKAQELVWEKSPYQLERENEQRLKKANVSKELIRSFHDSEIYSITEKTELCITFSRLPDAEGLSELIEFALDAETETEATLIIQTLDLLGRYSREISPIERIVIKRGLIIAFAQNGYQLLPIAVDYLHWTPLVSQALLSAELAADKREIWLTGEASPIAKLRLKHYGWEVFDRRVD